MPIKFFTSLSLSIFHLIYINTWDEGITTFYAFLFHLHHSPPPPLLRHVTNCANIEFSVGYPVSAVGGAAATLQGPAGGSTLNVSRNINKYVMLIFAQRWARGGRGGMEGRVTAT